MTNYFKIRKNRYWVLVILAGCYSNMTTNNSNVSSSNEKTNYSLNLEVIYTSGNNELNSLENYVKKDLVMDGFVEAPYYLSNEERNRIYRVLRDVDLSSFPENMGMKNSLTQKSLWIIYDNIEKKIFWDIWGEPKNEQEEILIKLEKVLDDILYNNSVYRSLPKARGVRL